MHENTLLFCILLIPECRGKPLLQRCCSGLQVVLKLTCTELLNTQRPEGQGKCPHPHPALLTAGKGPQAAGISISAAGPGWLCPRLATSQSSPRCAAGHQQEHRAAAVMAVSSQQCGMGGRLRALSGTVLRGRVRTGRGSSSSSAALGELAAANSAAPLEALLLAGLCPRPVRMGSMGTDL